MSLETCPICSCSARQRTPQGFVRCSDPRCPVYNISIPLAAWQSWPRGKSKNATGPLTVDTQQRQEIQRLQERVAEFGAVEQRNQQLREEAEAARSDLKHTAAKLKTANDVIYQLQQNYKKVAADRDIKQLELKKITDWAVGGAQVAWASGNDVYARFYEEALELMGKRDARQVPCEECKQLPNEHQHYDKPATLSCRCFTGTAREWLKRQRDTKTKRLAQAVPGGTKTLDRNHYLGNISRVRNATNGGTAQERLLADQTELLLRTVELLERSTGTVK